MRKMILSFVVVTAAALIVPAAARAQNPPRTPQQRDLQYQIATLESVLARAVEHGALEIRDRLQAIVPAQMLLSDNARVRGFPLTGYGIVFDVAVPGLDGTLPWSFQTMDQNNLGLESALSALRGAVDAVMRNPDEAYRQTITVHIKDAMLNHSIGLNLAPNEMLTVVAKSNEDMLLGASAPDSRVTTITVTSEDLAAFRSGQITREEAHRRIAVSVF